MSQDPRWSEPPALSALPALSEHPAAAYYAGPGRSGPGPRSLSGLGVLAFVTAAVATLFTCASAAVLPRAVRVRAEQGADAVDWSLMVYYLGSVLAFVGLLAGWVTASLWLFRARRNADALAPGQPHARRSGWAWAGWVVPFVAFWFPFQVVRDVRQALVPRGATMLVGCWWALFLVTELGLRLSRTLQDQAMAGVDAAEAARLWSVLTAAVMLAALAAWGQVLRAVTLEQHERMYAAPPAPAGS